MTVQVMPKIYTQKRKGSQKMIYIYTFRSLRISLASSLRPAFSNSVARVAQLTGFLPSPFSHFFNTSRLISFEIPRQSLTIASILSP